MQKVLIVEPHDYHYEVLPGVAYYFHALGYELYLLVRDKAQIDDVFINIPYKDSIHVDVFGDGQLQSKLGSYEMESFALIFFNSLEYFHGEKKDRLLDYLGYIPHTEFGIMGIYHNPDLITREDIPLIEEKRVFTLSNCHYKGYDLPILSASYFGKLRKKKAIGKNKNILFIGGSNDRIGIERAIGPSVRQYRRSNIRMGYIGAWNEKKELPSRLYHTLKGDGDIKGWGYIHKYGRLSFEEMYKCIEDSDFLLFYPRLEGGGEAFLQGKTSGTKQLSIGFLKPCILQENIAAAFGMPLDTCVTFKKTLQEAIHKIMGMSEDDYKGIVDRLEAYRESVLQESLNDLRHSITLCKKGNGNDI